MDDDGQSPSRLLGAFGSSSRHFAPTLSHHGGQGLSANGSAAVRPGLPDVRVACATGSLVEAAASECFGSSERRSPLQQASVEYADSLQRVPSRLRRTPLTAVLETTAGTRCSTPYPTLPTHHPSRTRTHKEADSPSTLAAAGTTATKIPTLSRTERKLRDALVMAARMGHSDTPAGSPQQPPQRHQMQRVACSRHHGRRCHTSPVDRDAVSVNYFKVSALQCTC
jgi:hypothetical protein